MDQNARTPIPVRPDAAVAVPVGDGEFELRLEIFEGPLALLLRLIESRQLDVLTVPLAEVADAYVAHLARQPVDATNLAEFVAVAAQLIYLKSRRLLPAEPMPPIPDGGDEPDEDELRRRLIEYRTLRNAAHALGELDGATPTMRREPREADLPEAPSEPKSAVLLAAALDRLAAIPEPAAPTPEVVPREITIWQQIAVLRTALSRSGRVVLQAILATCRTRTEAAVTFLATLELVRRREVSAEQSAIFGPITLDTMAEAEP
jgi:segregation and condensation protein A